MTKAKRKPNGRSTTVKKTDKKPVERDARGLFVKGNKGGGRPKGSESKATQLIKSGILEAYDRLGGSEYLYNIGREDPKTFCTLLGKVLPAEINQELKHTGDIVINVNTGISNSPPIGIHNSRIINGELAVDDSDS